MNEELYAKLNVLLGQISKSLSDIKKNGRKARELKKSVENSRKIVTEVLEQQLGGVSLEAQICISEIPDEDWLITARHIIDYINDPFVPINQYEIYFLDLTNYLLTTDKAKLLSNMLFSLNKLKENNFIVYRTFVLYFSRFDFWGSLDPDTGDFTTLNLRVDTLKHHAYDFLWLYIKTQDYISKRTLAAILMSWADIQIEALDVTHSIFMDYWEPDIFPDNKDDILVDLGAFTGDSIEKYVEVYGKGYKKIYAYEISDDSYNTLCQNIEEWGLHDVIPVKKGAGDSNKIMYIKECENSSAANSLSNTGDVEHAVEIVRIDNDIKDIPTFIKMDIEGSEKSALRGCEHVIRRYHPKLAICTYHGYEDIWKIPSMIYEMNPEYKFYMRHYGGNLIPTEFVLLCKP